MKHHALGLDFGTTSCRALIVDVRDGSELAVGSADYREGDCGVIGDARDRDVARQHPRDWRRAAGEAIREVIAASAARGVDATGLCGLGIDATASTPLPVDAQLRPLADDPRFRAEPAALAWLWKDHSAHAEAREITTACAKHSPLALERCGGSYSAEWFWSKVLRCARVAPAVFDAAATWLECCDYVPAWLTGQNDRAQLVRSACAARHKGLAVPELGGWPSTALLTALDSRLPRLFDGTLTPVASIDRAVGGVAPAVAAQLGLEVGTPVAVGAIDAHLGAVGAGVREGDLIKVLGTSSCDMAITRRETAPSANGLAGVALDSIVPGAFAIEAGQAAFGDAFAWAERITGGRGHAELEALALAQTPGASGLLALEWLNGNRSVLADPSLSGAILGIDLHTKPHELWRAMVEAACFGARVIVERMVENGIPIARVIVCGGIASRSEFVLQTLSNVLDREVLVAASTETCALGAAIAAAVAGGRHSDVPTAQAAMCIAPSRRYRPQPGHVALLARLFLLYRRIHDAFGGVDEGLALGSTMRELRALRSGPRP